ncbi:hypothetical protein SteCoe_24011 [Stentor coeruleus]|uniref:Methyltransferase domain-containing protein n=1 Tax=Stentor coeruleus TaxID=5963 RepID=A0A1R2BIN3_9CILI|nr:hypothetical protein SteCoe_24011 [Stentor coeruleus]
MIKVLILLITTNAFAKIKCESFESCNNLHPAPETQLYSLETLQNSFYSILIEIVLNSKLSVHEFRYEAYKSIIKYFTLNFPKILVETGTSRYGEKACDVEGCSTLIFGHIAKYISAKLYSIDINEESRKGAQSIIDKYHENIELIDSESIDYLTHFDYGLIDFLYLDSQEFDVDVEPSQKHYLKEISAAYPKLSKNAAVMIDDCGFHKIGNCDLVQEFLIERGWKIHFNEYLRIFTRF